MEYIIGVDGGGTKTEAAAYNIINGEELINIITGPGNMASGREEAVKNILDALRKCIEKLGTEGLKKIYLGLAGVEVGSNSSFIYNMVKKEFNMDPVVINDGELALKALLKGDDGILTIAGTGSIAFGIREGKRARAGGWGHLLGDEGSGYAVSVEALKRMTFEEDSSLEYSMLTRGIMEFLKINKVEEILEFVYSSDKSTIASIAPVVSKLAETGEENALRILQKEGIRLANTTLKVYSKLHFEDGCKVGIKGSVIQRAKVLRGAFESYLMDNINNILIVDEDVSSTKGAYYMFLRESCRELEEGE